MDSFVFYSSWLDIIESNYPDDIGKQNEIIRNIILYGIRGERNDRTEKMFMQQAFAQIDLAQKKHEKRVEAGRRGGQNGKGDAKKRYGNKNASKTQANDNVNDNDNDNVINIIDNVNSTAPTGSAPLQAAQPSVPWGVYRDENGKVVIKNDLGGDDTT